MTRLLIVLALVFLAAGAVLWWRTPPAVPATPTPTPRAAEAAATAQPAARTPTAPATGPAPMLSFAEAFGRPVDESTAVTPGSASVALPDEPPGQGRLVFLIRGRDERQDLQRRLHARFWCPDRSRTRLTLGALDLGRGVQPGSCTVASVDGVLRLVEPPAEASEAERNLVLEAARGVLAIYAGLAGGTVAVGGERPFAGSRHVLVGVAEGRARFAALPADAPVPAAYPLRPDAWNDITLRLDGGHLRGADWLVADRSGGDADEPAHFEIRRWEVLFGGANAVSP